MTKHRNVTEDGVRVEKERTNSGDYMRVAYVLGTCRDCGRRVHRRYQMTPKGCWNYNDGSHTDAA